MNDLYLSTANAISENLASINEAVQRIERALQPEPSVWDKAKDMASNAADAVADTAVSSWEAASNAAANGWDATATFVVNHSNELTQLVGNLF